MHHNKISLRTAILLNINIMVGSGILIGPSRIAAVAGNASFLTWMLVAVLMLPLVLCTVQLSRMLPGCGGFYAYAKAGINTAAGFTSGWLYVMGYIFTVAVDILALKSMILVALGDTWLTAYPPLFYCIMMCAFILFNLLGLRILSKILDSLTVAKVLPIIILIMLLPFVINANFSVAWHEVSLVPLSFTFAIFGFFGFEACCSVSHLIENSEKNAPRAILFGFLITAIVYTLFHFGLLQVMGADNLVKYGAPAFVNFLQVPIPYVTSLLMLLVPVASILAILAGSNGILNANAIMLHSMAQEGTFRGAHLLTPVTPSGRPWATLLVQGLIVISILLSMPYIDLVGGLSVLSVFLAFILPLVSLLIIQHNKRRFHYMPLTLVALMSVIGLACYSWYLLGSNLGERMLYSLPLIGVMAIGYMLYVGDRSK